MYDTALIDSGFTLEHTSLFSNRIYNMLEMGLGIEPEPIINNDNDNGGGDEELNSTMPELETVEEEEMENVD